MNVTFDRDLSARDIQSLATADTVAAFFAALGYNTDRRVDQTAAAMGITADGLKRKIRRIERVASQEDGALEVYLVELDTVTQDAIRGLARALRDRSGNYLLVLTSEYETLDFVLLERSIPALSKPGSFAPPRVTVRPRVLTFERRNPGQVSLRVLRRFTYTESDADAQYDKLLSAYAIAEWSEPLFNNHALFADYFLNERVPQWSEWAEDPKPTYLRLCERYRNARSRFGGAVEATTRRDLIEPVLRDLGFVITSGTGTGESPDYALRAPADTNSNVACLSYGWDRNLDGKDETRGAPRPDDNPGARVVSVLASKAAPWAIVTNGKLWRLYSSSAASQSTSYYEIDLDETLGSADPNDAFRYFWLFFRSAAFQPRPIVVEGENRAISFVDQILIESAAYARRLGDRLKDQVFEQVFPRLAQGFAAQIRHADGKDLSQEQLDEIFQGTLTLLYRLLFLLYAEARDLLPARDTRGYWEKSLTRLKAEVAKAGGAIKEEASKKIASVYSAKLDETALYDRLQELARIVDLGDATVNTPLYNGGLFLTAPELKDDAPEAESARFLLHHQVPDRYLAEALDLLARDVDEKRGDLVPIDYKSLGVRQIGSIYEGLLEFRLRIAPEKLAIVKGKKTEEILLYAEALKQKRTILTEGRGKSATERTLPKGEAYLENDRRERKATGSYYTPDHIVTYIVENAVGPVLDEHLEKLRPRLREAQRAYQTKRKQQVEFLRRGMPGDDPEKLANEPKWRELADDLFAFRVLDPAMGSGHFLVQAVDYITDRILDFLNSFPWNPVQATLRQTREAIQAEMDRQGVQIDAAKLTDVILLKRHVLKRCIYGVDLNRMAVELAKVSLWLHCFTLGAPLSFLDHHLKWGNSLIGTTVRAVEEELARQQKGFTGTLFGGPFQGLLAATALAEELSRIPDATVEESRRSHSLFAEFEKEQAPYKAALDIWVSRYFGNRRAAEYLTVTASNLVEEIRNGGVRLSPEYRQVIKTAAGLQRTKRFFHWDLEFPEAFLDLRKQEWKPLDQQGFDAVIGNPPYDVMASEELGYDVSQDLAYFGGEPLYRPAIRGKTNLYKLFICRGLRLARRGGGFSFIVPMPLLGDDQAAGVRRLLLEDSSLTAIEAFPQKDNPHERVFPEAKLATTIFVVRRQTPGPPFVVHTHPGASIAETSAKLEIAAAEIAKFDPVNYPVPSCTQRDWEIAKKIVGNSRMKRLGDYCQASQGEINETTDGKKGYISSNPADGPQILRGSAICLYIVREASQGEPIFLRKEKFLAGKPGSAKAHHHEERRVGWQESSPQNNFRRIIAAAIPANEFCNHLINYIPESASRLSLDMVAALLNSKILEWYFRLGSTNAHVSHYQVENLPVPATAVQDQPPCNRSRNVVALHSTLRELGDLLRMLERPGVLPEEISDSLAEMSRRIQQIEASRTLKSRSERSRLAPESQQIQDAIDAVLFRCYGLSDDEARYIEQRLGEML